MKNKWLITLNSSDTFGFKIIAFEGNEKEARETVVKLYHNYYPEYDYWHIESLKDF